MAQAVEHLLGMKSLSSNRSPTQKQKKKQFAMKIKICKYVYNEPNSNCKSQELLTIDKMN
jgi:hypothetical protein